MRVRKAVIPAAGFGTRFLPASKVIPKEMIPIIDKPMIQYIVEECVNAGIQEIIIVISKGKELILQHFHPSYSLENFLKEKNKEGLLQELDVLISHTKISSIEQKKPLGLGHAVLTAKEKIGNEPFAVLLGDDLVDSKIPCIKQLIDIFDQYETSVLGVMEVPKQEVSKYGIVGGTQISKQLLRVLQMVEKPLAEQAPSQLACPGRYVLTPGIFKILENTKPGKNGEVQLTDALDKLAQSEGLLAYQFEGTRYDTGDKIGFIEATLAFALKRHDLKVNVRKFLEKY